MSQTAAQELSRWDSLTNRNENRHATGYVYDTDSDAPLIAKLPAEILILIFEQGHEDDWKNMSFSHKICSVCRYWRTLAICTSSLWSPIIFEVDELPDCRSLVGLYLERSKGFPVEIFVYSGMNDLLADDCNVLIPHLSHCRSLTIQGAAHSLYPDIKRLGSAEMPLLENLELSITGLLSRATSDNPWFSPPSRALFSSPNLQTVSMDMVELDTIDVTQYFVLVNVTNFYFRWQCRLTGDQGLLSEDAGVKTFMSQIVEGMPKLRELLLECTDASPNAIIVPLLNSLPPSLTSLDLEGIPIAWEVKYGNWQRRDFSRLRILRLSFHPAADPLYADVFALLGITPNLKELYVGHVDLLQVPNLWQVVQPVRLARLESFTLEWWAEEHTIEAFLQTLVAPTLSKLTFIAAPKSLSISDPDDPNPNAPIPVFWRSSTQVQSITLNRRSISKNIDLLTALRDVLKNVRNLDLRGNSQWGNGSDLSGNPEWDDELLRGLGTSPWLCPPLETVSFAYIPDLTQDALETFLRARTSGFLAGECAEIRSVAMRGCPGLRVTDALVEMVQNVWHRI